MLMSNLFGQRLRDKPSEASFVSHILLLRGGYIRNVGSGIFSLMPPATKVCHKINKIIREEMEKIGGQEVILPVVVPAELWKKSGRFESVGSELLRLKDRCDRDMVLSMTHEEPAVHLAKSEAKSYLDFPFMIYQIQTKFRDEPRARGGLIRVREFTMKDAYSFHTSWQDLEEYYNKAYLAYENIFRRVGLKNTVAIKSDSGMMGGSVAHEFMLLSPNGEDSLVMCPECGYKANMEVADSILHPQENSLENLQKKEIYTPEIKTIEDLCRYLKTTPQKTVKAVAYLNLSTQKPVLVFLRGDLQVNETKLKKILGCEISDSLNLENFGLVPGFLGPQKEILQKTQVLFDSSLQGTKNMVCGANKKDCHIVGFEIEKEIENIEFNDIRKVESGDICINCKHKLEVNRGIEIGNIFQLGTKYTQSMNMEYIDSDGKAKTPIMGCYGIGVGRLLACIVEENHDDFGPIWPKSVAPWQIHICVLNSKTGKEMQVGESLYQELLEKYEVLFDDRTLAAGAKFADADLLGIPVRVTISQRNLEQEKFEVILRENKNEKILMNKAELLAFLEDFYA